MTLKDKIDKEIPCVNKKNIKSIVLPFSFLETAEAYINSHPNEEYGLILNSGDTEDMIHFEMKKYVYGKILDQLVQEYEVRMPNPIKYEHLIKEQREYIEDILFAPEILPEKIEQQYTSWIRTTGKYNMYVQNRISDLENMLKIEKKPRKFRKRRK